LLLSDVEAEVRPRAAGTDRRERAPPTGRAGAARRVPGFRVAGREGGVGATASVVIRPAITSCTTPRTRTCSPAAGGCSPEGVSRGAARGWAGRGVKTAGPPARAVGEPTTLGRKSAASAPAREARAIQRRFTGSAGTTCIGNRRGPLLYPRGKCPEGDPGGGEPAPGRVSVLSEQQKLRGPDPFQVEPAELPSRLSGRSVVAYARRRRIDGRPGTREPLGVLFFFRSARAARPAAEACGRKARRDPRNVGQLG